MKEAAVVSWAGAGDKDGWTVNELRLRMNMLYREIEHMSSRTRTGGSCNAAGLQSTERMFQEYTDEYGRLTERQE